jgi:predicted N-acetyltransferase YhbS
MIIRPTNTDDLDAISMIHETAFGQNDEALLTAALLTDPSAAPKISLIAIVDGKPVGHILFTRASLTIPKTSVTASILAPLAVVPEVQGTGIGGELIRNGLKRLADDGTDLVFVLGHPSYYPRFGFHPAGACNLDAPYPIPPQHADAWMVLSLTDGLIGTVQGQVACADALSKPEYWVE